MEQIIEQKLRAAFDPAELSVTNDSEAHRGHGGYVDGNTHFSVRMRAASLAGMSRVAAQRAVMAALKDEFEAGLHALAMDVAGV